MGDMRMCVWLCAGYCVCLCACVVCALRTRMSGANALPLLCGTEYSIAIFAFCLCQAGHLQSILYRPTADIPDGPACMLSDHRVSVVYHGVGLRIFGFLLQCWGVWPH